MCCNTSNRTSVAIFIPFIIARPRWIQCLPSWFFRRNNPRVFVCRLSIFFFSPTYAIKTSRGADGFHRETVANPWDAAVTFYPWTYGKFLSEVFSRNNANTILSLRVVSRFLRPSNGKRTCRPVDFN